MKTCPNSHGKVLTTNEVADHLQLEQNERDAKRKQKPAKKIILLQKENRDPSSDEKEESDDEEDETAYTMCNHLWRNYKLRVNNNIL